VERRAVIGYADVRYRSAGAAMSEGFVNPAYVIGMPPP